MTSISNDTLAHYKCVYINSYIYLLAMFLWWHCDVDDVDDDDGQMRAFIDPNPRENIKIRWLLANRHTK